MQSEVAANFTREKAKVAEVKTIFSAHGKIDKT